MQRLCFTCGDINGIGPEITLKTFNKIYNPPKRQIVFFCPSNVFEKTAAYIKPEYDFQILKNFRQALQNSGKILIVDLGKAESAQGQPSVKAGKIAFKSIKAGFEVAKNHASSAVVTAPISKTSFKLAGIEYPGQTEIFADLSNSKNYMMVFLSSKIICGLVTIHEPIRKVSKLIGIKRVENKLKILERFLRIDLKIKNPKIAVLGLNPHAGENGLIGNEETEILEPSIKFFSNKNISGPFVPDAFFATKKYKHFDAVLGMYHDQLLIPFKMMNFNKGVNYTAGLSVVRTSPDHGTAFDIAGRGIADPASMIEAVAWAEKICWNRTKNV